MKKNYLRIICVLMLSYGNAFTQIPTDSLVAWYPFNGNANDSSGNGFNGTLSGQYSVASTCGRAYYFIDNFIDCGDPLGNQFDLVNNASLSLWMALFSPPSTSGSGPYNGYFTLIGKDVGPGNTEKWFLAITNNELIFHINAPSSPSFPGAWAIQTTFSFVLSTLYHIVVTKTANTYKFYVNGINYGSQTVPLNIVDVPASLKIGDLHDGSKKINAMIDEVLIYHKTLTQTEINQLFAHCSSGLVTAVRTIAQDQAVNINIFPNPTNGSFSIKMNLPIDFADKKIRIINMNGQLIKELNTRQNNVNMNIDKEGIYLVQITSKQIFRGRLMVVAH